MSEEKESRKKNEAEEDLMRNFLEENKGKETAVSRRWI